MKLLFDFFPILLFFITYQLYEDQHEGILAATAVIIVATLIQVAWTWFRNRRLETVHLVTLGLVIIFGSATLLLKDEMFIKWKPTVVNWLFAAAFLISGVLMDKPLIRRMMQGNLELPDEIWKRLNLAWGSFFILMGGLNLYVVYHFDTDTWVNFKLFGLLGLTIAFVVGQSFYLMRHMKDDELSEE